jgi:hypothetical protein
MPATNPKVANLLHATPPPVETWKCHFIICALQAASQPEIMHVPRTRPQDNAYTKFHHTANKAVPSQSIHPSQTLSMKHPKPLTNANSHLGRFVPL